MKRLVLSVILTLAAMTGIAAADTRANECNTVTMNGATNLYCPMMVPDAQRNAALRQGCIKLNFDGFVPAHLFCPTGIQTGPAVASIATTTPLMQEDGGNTGGTGGDTGGTDGDSGGGDTKAGGVSDSDNSTGSSDQGRESQNGGTGGQSSAGGVNHNPGSGSHDGSNS